MVRKANGADFNFIYGLYMHPQVNPFLLYDPMPAASFREIFEDLLRKELIYIFSHDGIDAGMFKLVPLEHRTSHIVYLGGLAIDPLQGGKGLGHRMMQEILALAVERRFLRVELSVTATNERAISLYKKAGFEKEGILRKYSYLAGENKFVDEIIMAWIHPDIR